MRSHDFFAITPFTIVMIFVALKIFGNAARHNARHFGSSWSRWCQPKPRGRSAGGWPQPPNTWQAGSTPPPIPSRPEPIIPVPPVPQTTGVVEDRRCPRPACLATNPSSARYCRRCGSLLSGG